MGRDRHHDSVGKDRSLTCHQEREGERQRQREIEREREGVKGGALTADVMSNKQRGGAQASERLTGCQFHVSTVKQLNAR